MIINVAELAQLFPEGTCNAIWSCGRPVVAWQKQQFNSPESSGRFLLAVRTRNGKGVDLFNVGDQYQVELSELVMPSYLGGNGQELKETGYGTGFRF